MSKAEDAMHSVSNGFLCSESSVVRPLAECVRCR